MTGQADGNDCYATAKQMGVFKTIKRTEGISTTDIVGRMLLMNREHHIRYASLSPAACRLAGWLAGPTGSHVVCSCGCACTHSEDASDSAGGAGGGAGAGSGSANTHGRRRSVSIDELSEQVGVGAVTGHEASKVTHSLARAYTT